MEKYIILLVEDDESLAMVLTDSLEMHGYTVVHASDGLMALEKYKLHEPGLILLDVIIPEKNGYEVAREIRSRDQFIPILFMTGTEVEEPDRLKAYDIGACDYLIKPLLPAELIAKIKVWQATRRVVNMSVKQYKIDHNVCYLDQSSFTMGNVKVSLTGRQQQVVEVLLDHFGEFVNKSDLLLSVWKTDLPYNEQMLRNNIKQIREKISPLPLEIKQLYGHGYSLRNKE